MQRAHTSEVYSSMNFCKMNTSIQVKKQTIRSTLHVLLMGIFPGPAWFPHQGKPKFQLKITLLSLSSFCFLYKQNHAPFMLLHVDPLAQCALCAVHESLVCSLARPSCLWHHISFYEYITICLSSLLLVGSFQICFRSTYRPSMQII